MPFALSYAVWIYNRLPHSSRANMSARVFGCPTYVLDPKLQDGKKIPKWEAQARTGMFLRFSDVHSSTVGLVLNIRTGYILPQCHVVCNEKFKTVASKRSIDPSETWIDLWQHSRDFYLDAWDPTVDGPLPELDSDFLPDSDKQGEGEEETEEEAHVEFHGLA